MPSGKPWVGGKSKFGAPLRSKLGARAGCPKPAPCVKCPNPSTRPTVANVDDGTSNCSALNGNYPSLLFSDPPADDVCAWIFGKSGGHRITLYFFKRDGTATLPNTSECNQCTGINGKKGEWWIALSSTMFGDSACWFGKATNIACSNGNIIGTHQFGSPCAGDGCDGTPSVSFA